MHRLSFRAPTINLAAIVVGLAALAGSLAGCGGEPLLELSPIAAEGRQISNTNGCASCHGKNGQGVTAPSWQGIYGAEIELDDGTTVIADDEYLHTSITDPSAQKVADYTIKMPENSLTDDQIDKVIAYIKELG